jgi:hypothetical protein
MLPSRSETKATRRPSGEAAALKSSAAWSVSRVVLRDFTSVT